MRGDPTGVFLLIALIWAVATLVLYLKMTTAHGETSREKAAKEHAQQRLSATENNLKTTIAALEQATAAKAKAEQTTQAMQTILRETGAFYPSLAEATADFYRLEAEKDASFLERKSRPAIGGAESTRRHGKARSEAERSLRQLKYQLITYENAFPWIVEYSGRSTRELLDEWEARRNGSFQDQTESEGGGEREPERRWLSDEEFRSLSEADRSDLALVRWQQSRRASSWEAGRDYERFVGYRLEQAGHEVDYWGATEGLEDMGRDLIARKGKTVKIVQCKRWSADKTVHEKHIFQLIGTSLEFACFKLRLPLERIDLRAIGITPILATTTVCSERARHAAQLLGVELQERLEYTAYPMIKCNIAGRTSEKIYHLPFDQQYDRVRIKPEHGEFFASSAADAHKKGFRRARRYRPT